MEPLVFSFKGIPRGKGTARAAVRGRFATVYKDGKTRQYENSVAKLAKDAMAGRPPLTGALSVSMRFRMPIPKSAPKWQRLAMAAGEIPHTSKPDCSNALKAIEDAFNGVVWVDDSQIVRGFQTKVYSDHPGVDVRVEALEPQEPAA